MKNQNILKIITNTLEITSKTDTVYKITKSKIFINWKKIIWWKDIFLLDQSENFLNSDKKPCWYVLLKNGEKIYFDKYIIEENY